MKELFALKEALNCLSAAEDSAFDELHSQTKSCISKRLEVLTASGIITTNNLDEAIANLECNEKENFNNWKSNALQSIDLCVEKLRIYEEMKQAAPQPYLQQ